VQGKLRENRNYLDVTLASDDGHQIEVQGIMLSAGSTFLSEILKKNQHHSFIYVVYAFCHV
jgi:hypothetical protein